MVPQEACGGVPDEDVDNPEGEEPEETRAPESVVRLPDHDETLETDETRQQQGKPAEILRLFGSGIDVWLR